MPKNLTYLAMLLEAPLQSWGYMSRFDRRTSLSYPSKSGVIGLLCAAMGIDRKNEKALDVFREIGISVFILRHGSRMTDYHTVGGGWDKKTHPQNVVPKAKDTPGSHSGQTVQTYREYLQDACFGVILCGTDEIVSQAAFALVNPKWGVWLGRKCCIPSKPVFQGVFEDQASAIKKLLESGQAESIELFIEEADSFENGTDTIMDNPLDFAQRQFAPRRIRTQTVV